MRREKPLDFFVTVREMDEDDVEDGEELLSERTGEKSRGMIRV